MRRLLTVSLLAICGPFAAVALPQQVAGYVFPPDGEAAIGYACVGVGDLDGDGVADFLLDGRLPDLRGRIWAISGRTTQVIHTIEDPEVVPSPQYRYIFAGLGDVDDDGVGDFAIASSLGLEERGWVAVHSGATAVELYRLTGRQERERFGNRLANAGDLDGDGVSDLLVAAYRRGYPGGPYGWKLNCGAVDAISGRDGTPIHTSSTRRMHAFFGSGLAAIGDVDGDGLADYVVGSYLDGWPNEQRGSAQVVSGASGAVLYQLRGPTLGSFFGEQVEGVGDLDGDGISDFVVNAAQETVDETAAFGVAHLHSGSDGAHRIAIPESDNGVFSNCVTALGDLDADGWPDFAVSHRASAPAYGEWFTGRLRVFSGRDHHVLYDMWGPVAGARFGTSVVPLGDTNGDGAGDFAVGVPGVSYGGQNGSGVVVIYRGGPCVAWPACTSTPNSVGPGAFLSWQGSLSLAANDFTVTAVGAPPNAVALFLMGDLATDEPFGAGRLCVGSSRGRPTELLPWLVTSDAGTAARPVDLEQHSVLALRPERFQLLYRDLAANPPTFNTSDALELVTCP